MYQKILVPLDGSELAECVLPHVQSIAQGCSVKAITLLRVVEPVYLTGPDEMVGFSGDAVEKLNASRQETAKNYLTEVIRRTKFNGAEVTTEAFIGRPMDDITDYAKKIGADLIAIATHGRSGISRWVWGSVADRVLRSACVPVLMVRPKGCIPGI